MDTFVLVEPFERVRVGNVYAIVTWVVFIPVVGGDWFKVFFPNPRFSERFSNFFTVPKGVLDLLLGNVRVKINVEVFKVEGECG
jgi:hypothetical protein